MYGRYSDDIDIDIDGKDSNGNKVGGFGYDWNSGDDSHLVRRQDECDYHPIKKTTHYKYQFQTEEELVMSDFFQKQLTMALAFKDETIRKLQNELMKPYWARK